VSWAKWSTSYHTFPSLSTISNIPIILSLFIITVGNCCGLPNENVVVLIVADTASTSFFNKKNVGLPDDIWYTVISVGSEELETEKSTLSWVINEVTPTKVEVTDAFLPTFKV